MTAPKREAKSPRVDPEFAERLAAIDRKREKLGWSIKEMSKKAGSGPTTWHNWRAGLRTEVSEPKIRAYERAVDAALGPDQTQVVDGTSQPPGGGRQGTTDMPSSETRTLAQLIRLAADRMDKQHRDELLTMVTNYIETHTTGARNPQSPDGKPTEDDPGRRV